MWFLKIGIINVGVNTSHGKLRSPIFDDGAFEFVPIPCCPPTECPDETGNCSQCIREFSVFPRYEELYSPNGRKFREFIPPDLLKMRTHNDPEFKTFTYGDFPSLSPRASNLKRLETGDNLLFLARLVKWRDGRFTDNAGFYLIGFLEIEHIFDKDELVEMVETCRFDNKFERIKRNGHMLIAEKYPDFWLGDALGWKGSWVFSGSKRSERFTFAVPFNRELADEVMRDARGRRWTWPENQTELQRIGSYTRSCRIIENRTQIDKLWEIIRLYNPD